MTIVRKLGIPWWPRHGARRARGGRGTFDPRRSSLCLDRGGKVGRPRHPSALRAWHGARHGVARPAFITAKRDEAVRWRRQCGKEAARRPSDERSDLAGRGDLPVRISTRRAGLCLRMQTPARLRLSAGNRSFAELLDRVAPTKPARLSIDVDPHDVGLFPGTAQHQNSNSFAAIVGCADARVPVELIFSEGPNDLFVVRTAGNGLGDDVMGSLSYAVDHLKHSLRSIVVLGHSRCGAVSAAVDVHLEPAKYMEIMSQNDLRHIVDRTLVVIQLGATWLERVHGTEVIRRPGYRTTLIEVADRVLNAALTAHGMRPESELGRSR